MRHIRRAVYRAGFRPRPGSILYSPSAALIYSIRDADISGAFREAMRAGEK
ncbi:hypothetical protein SEA_ITER_27 [Arthrobacter phage Iter]|uniref:Uncharacterized protein n=1 Tax=Arthrobacter phage Ascela TaxID=3038360 RepID=A0AAF0K1J0_9CAUD|nr:hypothetical protein SEA_ITER_27 [Arthrobacter phage Iter]WGH21550.1 hypothetical protein SEA_ASCELA_27 [Arthrobacter phage Ascela]